MTKEDKLRLRLRSVYLKGVMDGNLKTADMSWEDEIVSAIQSLYAEEMGEKLKEENLVNIVSPILDIFGDAVYNYDTPNVEGGIQNIHKTFCCKIAQAITNYLTEDKRD